MSTRYRCGVGVTSRLTAEGVAVGVGSRMVILAPWGWFTRKNSPPAVAAPTRAQSSGCNTFCVAVTP